MRGDAKEKVFTPDWSGRENDFYLPDFPLQ
jgi:hypothetical protein